MASRLEPMRSLKGKSDVILLAVCALLAVAFLALAASNVTMAGSFLSIDSLFFTTVCLLLALTFIAIPVMTLRERGMLKNPFAIPEGVTPARALEGTVHFEGSFKLFIGVLGGLLALTLIEVFLAYIHLRLDLMLTILIGLSLIKAAMIMAYFMHLRFERMSLVLTLVPVMVVCICLLFIFFPDSFRSRQMRATPVSAAQTSETGTH